MMANGKFRAFKRTILITGSTEGVGRQTALELAARQNENFVVIHGSSAEKCEVTVDFIVRENKLPDRSNVDYIVADFSDLREVARMATEVERRFPTLNALVCNATILPPKRTESRNGLELIFQVNHLAHFLLMNRVLDVLKTNEPSRIIVVSSTLHSWHKLDWDDIMAEQEYDKYLQYSRSKLMNHLTAFAMHRLLVRQGCHFTVTSNAVELGESEPHRQKRARSRSTSISSSDTTLMLSTGAGTLLNMIEQPAYNGVSGKYFDRHGKQIRSGSDATDERLQTKLWNFSEELCSEFLKCDDNSNYK